MMAVADAETSLVLTGNGDVLEPEDGLIGIGSGGSFALAAARALVDVDALDAEAIARKAMKIAGDICIYTNQNITIESLQGGSGGVRHDWDSKSHERQGQGSHPHGGTGRDRTERILLPQPEG